MSNEIPGGLVPGGRCFPAPLESPAESDRTDDLVQGDHGQGDRLDLGPPLREFAGHHRGQSQGHSGLGHESQAAPARHGLVAAPGDPFSQRGGPGGEPDPDRDQDSGQDPGGPQRSQIEGGSSDGKKDHVDRQGTSFDGVDEALAAAPRASPPAP